MSQALVPARAVSVRTQRLVVRPVAAEDAGELLAYHVRNREHLERWEPERPRDFETLAYWERFVTIAEHEFRSGTRARFVATEASEGGIVAAVNLHAIERGVAQRAVLGYSADARSQGRGLAREAVGAVVGYAFDTLRLHRLEANYQPVNERSGRLLRALGFVIEGYARDYLYIAGAWRDHVLTSLTRP